MSDPKVPSQVKYNRALAAGRKALQSQAKVNWTLGDLAHTGHGHVWRQDG